MNFAQRFGWCVALGVGLLFGGPALGRTNVNTQILKPATNAKGLLVNESGLLQKHLEWYFGIINDYSYKPVALFGQQLIEHRYDVDFSASIGLYDWVEISLQMPVTAHQRYSQIETPTAPIERFTAGDLRFGAKLKLYRDEARQIGLALQLNVTFPTSTSNNGVGEKLLSYNPMLAFSIGKPFYFGVNIGATLRHEQKTIDGVRFGHELNASLGVGYLIQPIKLMLFAEAYGSLELKAPTQSEVPIEVLFGLRWRVWHFGIIAGGGLRATKGVGAAKARGFLGFFWNPQNLDRDGDGILDDVDKCPDDPEDKDGFEDSDGCPDPDNDKDGICDPWVAQRGLSGKYAHICKGSDKCPNDAEDKDGFEDEDGCPDPDNDKDGVCDPWVAQKGLGAKYASLCTGSDKCPDKSGPKANNGCPYGDSDGDGLTDDVDKCPTTPGPRENHGCPYGDRDKDGVPDNLDKCPDQPGPKSNQGCPRVRVTAKKIEILDKVFFQINKATIKPESFGLLNEVAALLKKHTEIEQVQVEGHTDITGRRSSNIRLSKRRAQSVVKYLVAQGVDKSRLTYKGFGPDKPLVKGTTKEALSKNRRVEFTILKRRAK